MLIITRTKSEHDQVLNLYMKVLDKKKINFVLNSEIMNQNVVGVYLLTFMINDN